MLVCLPLCRGMLLANKSGDLIHAVKEMAELSATIELALLDHGTLACNAVPILSQFSPRSTRHAHRVICSSTRSK